MKTVHLYYTRCYKAYMASERGEGWNMEPWGSNTPSYEGETLKEGAFELPDEYEIAETQWGSPCIALGDRVCELWTENGMPKLDHPDHPYGLFLKRASTVAAKC